MMKIKDILKKLPSKETVTQKLKTYYSWAKSKVKAPDPQKISVLFAELKKTDIKTLPQMLVRSKGLLITLIAGFVLVFSVIVSITGLIGSTKLEMAIVDANEDYQSELVHGFAQQVAQESQGELVVAVYAGEKLASEEGMTPGVRSGAFEIGKLPADQFVRDDLIYEAFSIPGLTKDYLDARALYDQIKPHFSRILNASNLELLYATPASPRGMFTNKVIFSAQDLKGLNFSTDSERIKQWGGILGMNYVELEGSALKSDLGSKEIDVLIASADEVKNLDLLDNFSYFYDLKSVIPLNLVFINSSAIQDMDPDLKQALQRAAAQSEASGWDSVAQRSQWLVEQLSKQGIKIAAISSVLDRDVSIASLVVRYSWLGESQGRMERILSSYLEDHQSQFLK